VKPDPPLGRSNLAMNRPAAAPGGDPPAAPAAVAGPEAGAAMAPGEVVDERVLVARARDRDQEAFRVLVDLHRDRALGLALRITRSRADAEDVAQEAFVRAWAALPRFRGESAFGTWLHRIVARRALDRAETLRTRRGRETVLDDAERAEAPVLDGERDPLLAARLERLMSQLTPAQRAVVSLFYGRDHAVEDIAESLGIPENTVKTHLARARAALREAWQREEGVPA
jgi:RNA polymerase sigma-70 factor, ECF subfamily